jgi:RNA polymerase subunit RPABC4/transcription elongation factor Spt4
MDDESKPVFVLACASCGKTVSGGESACPRCGVSFEDLRFECPFCGELVVPELRKCPSCGTAFDVFAEDVADKATVELDGHQTAPEEVAGFECPNCGKAVSEGDKECPGCGARFTLD